MLRSKVLIYIFMLSCMYGAKYLAVLELEPVGLSNTEAKILTQRLTSQLIAISDYTIVERANIEKILKEQKFQNSGCTDSECAVEIGQLINADVTVIGTVSKFGETYTIDARIISVEGGEALESASYTHTGKIDELVKTGIESVAHELLGIPYEPGLESGDVKESEFGGTLNITSEPEGAKVYIGGNYFKKTPLLLKDFPSGNHDVIITLEGYDDYSTTVKLRPKDTKSINAGKLAAQFGHLDLTLKPSSATVYFNGEKSMVLNIPSLPDTITPSFDLGIGTYDVRAEYPFYYTKSKEIDIIKNERSALEITLKPKSPSIAKKRAWLFPGLGHMYAYSDSKGKRLMAIGAVSIVGTLTMLNSYSNNADAYDIAKADYLSETDDGDAIRRKFNIYENLGKDKARDLIGTAGFGTSLLVVWVWSILDVNNVIPNAADLQSGISIDINSRGQLEASIAF